MGALVVGFALGLEVVGFFDGLVVDGAFEGEFAADVKYTTSTMARNTITFIRSDILLSNRFYERREKLFFEFRKICTTKPKIFFNTWRHTQSTKHLCTPTSNLVSNIF